MKNIAASCACAYKARLHFPALPTFLVRFAPLIDVNESTSYKCSGIRKQPVAPLNTFAINPLTHIHQKKKIAALEVNRSENELHV
jgi:hypothetical protein